MQPTVFIHCLENNGRFFLFERPCFMVSPACHYGVELCGERHATGPVASLYVPSRTTFRILPTSNGQAPRAVFLPFCERHASASLLPARIPLSAEVHHRLTLAERDRAAYRGALERIDWNALIRVQQVRVPVGEYRRRMAALHHLERRVVAEAENSARSAGWLREINTTREYGQFIRVFGVTPRRYLSELLRRLALSSDFLCGGPKADRAISPSPAKFESGSFR